MIQRPVIVGGIVSLVVILLAISSIVSGASPESYGLSAEKSPYLITDAVTSGSSHTYPIMRPDEEQLKEWNSQYLAAPKAVPRASNQVKTQDLNASSVLEYLTYNSTERDQKDCANCWVWSSTAAIEIAHSSQNNIFDRLSIQYANSRYKNGGKEPFTSADFACNGGTPTEFATFYNLAGKYGGNKTSIPWSNGNASFQDGNSSSLGHTRVDSSSINMTPSYLMKKMSASRVETLGLTQENAISNIKSLIDSGKPVILSFYLPDQKSWNAFYNFWDTGSEENSYFDIDAFKNHQYSSSGGEHSVLVTGYTDDGTKGYWQCLNSWGGPTNRPNGLFYLNMYMDYSASYPDAAYMHVTQWETIDVTYVQGGEDPNGTPISMTADFEASPATGYPPLSVHFTDLSIGEPTTWNWDFGDGGGSIISNPNHTYSKPGKYSVKLSVGRGGYSAITEQKDVVTVKIPYITITPFPKLNGGNYSIPTDPDGDGRFEDINGNGWLEYEDPIILLKDLSFAMKKEPVLQFDFDSSGFIGYGDVVELQKMV